MGDDGTSTDEASGSRQRTKVERLIEQHGLDDMGEELERYWSGTGVERRSLRALGDHFNEQMLRSAMSAAGLNPLDGEAANVYRLLTDDDVTSGERTDVKRQLEREGVDVEQLRTDFVSHQAIHTYLRSVRGVSLEDDGEAPVAKATDVVRQLNARTQAVSESTVESLVSKGEVTIGEHTVTSRVQVTCQDCNSQYDLVRFLRRGRCECSPE